MPAPQHPRHVFHEEQRRLEGLHESRNRCKSVIPSGSSTPASLNLGGLRSLGMAAMPRSKSQKLSASNSSLAELSRRHERDVALFELRSSPAKIVSISSAGVLVLLDRKLDRESGTIGGERKTAGACEQVHASQAIAASSFFGRRLCFLAKSPVHTLPEKTRRGTYSRSPGKSKIGRKGSQARTRCIRVKRYSALQALNAVSLSRSEFEFPPKI